MQLLDFPPVSTLLARMTAELSGQAIALPGRPIRVSRAPGRLDVMGGIADYTGSLVCEMPLDRAAAVAIRERDDRQVQVFSFNLYDEHKPFTLRIPLDALATQSADALRRGFAEPGRTWAGYLAGCLFVLHEQGYVDLLDPATRGLDVYVLSTVPLGAGVSSSAAIEVATMLNLADHFGLRETGNSRPTNTRKGITALRLAELCQRVEQQIVGAPCGIMDQVTSCLGEARSLLRMVCQPHELLPPLVLPSGIRIVGINSNVKHSVGGGAYGKTRCAAFMAHAMILDTMRRMGEAMGRELSGDPMRGYLANLDANDYKKHFRPSLPESMRGDDFLTRYRGTIDTVTAVDPTTTYAPQHAADHHVLEAGRVRRFADFIEQVADLENPRRGPSLRRAGHLMYASHLSYTMDAMLGAPECDVLVDLVREREGEGLFGARITGGGSGGTVAVLCRETDRTDAALAEIMAAYEQRTGLKPELLAVTSEGAWKTGTSLVAVD